MTGYTGTAYEKKMTFKQFVMLCARAFGATIEMRDEDMDAEIPAEFKPSTYHATRLEQERKRLVELQAMTQEQKVLNHANARDEDAREAADSKRRADETNAYFDKLLMHVRYWPAPSPEHEGLKKFMIEQLEGSRETSGYWNDVMEGWKSRTVAGWYEEELAQCQRDIEYNEKGQREELARCAQRNTWLRLLRESLK